MRGRGILIGLLVLSAPAIAYACVMPTGPEKVVFPEIPAGLDKRLAILRVTFPDVGPPAPGVTPRLAIVDNVVRGPDPGPMVDVLVEGGQSGMCLHADTSGKSGFIVGRLRPGQAGGRSEFLPIYESGLPKAASR